MNIDRLLLKTAENLDAAIAMLRDEYRSLPSGTTSSVVELAIIRVDQAIMSLQTESGILERYPDEDD